jgi:TRAP-type C4-dicarboxylate transport system substrate-binding protein
MVRRLTRRDFLKTSGGVLAGASLLGVAGCGGGDGSAEETGGDGSAQGEPVTLTLSHQWPQATTEEGDFRSVLAERFAAQVEDRTNGQVTVRIAPSGSLVPADEQYEALMQGTIDMTIYPLIYGAGQVPAFGLGQLPTLVRSHTQAQNWQDAEIGQRTEQILEENGVKVLVWIWNALSITSKGEPLAAPEDIEPGMQMRVAGPEFEDMMARAGAALVSMPSSETYSAMQTGVLNTVITSTGSSASYNLYEQADSYVSTRENLIGMAFEPLLISMDAWEQLSPEQQKTLEKVGADLQNFAYEASERDDIRVEQEFEEAGVNVVQMPNSAYREWQELAQPSLDDFAESVEGGQELINLAQEVPADRELPPLESTG